MTRLHLDIADDGMLTLPPALNILPPADWQTTETPGTYHCTLPACRRRRFSYGIRERQLWVRFHCTLKRADCTSDECRACPQAEPESGELKQLPVEERGGNQTIIQGRYSAQPDLHVAAQTPEEFRRPWIVDHFHPPQAIPPAKASSSLAAIEATLPPYKEGRDRKVRFEADGTIVYEKEQGHWEPPRDINGYQRDPENSWRFIPLWKPCALRHQVGVRYANCGCINIIMRCGHPKCPKFGDRVSHTDCADCLLRTQEPNDGMPGLPGQS